MSDKDLTAEEQLRVNTLRQGGEFIDALLFKHFGVHYNIVIVVCPAGEKTVSMVSKIESIETLGGMLGVAIRTAVDEMGGNSETLQ